MIRITLAAVLAATLAAGAAHAQVSALKLVQPGDSAMSCTALAAEINSLSEGQTKAASRAASGRKLLGFATTAMSLAGPMLGGGVSGANSGGMGGMLAQQALGALQTQAMQAQMSGGNPAATAGVSIEVQRMARLSEIFASKGC